MEISLPERGTAPTGLCPAHAQATITRLLAAVADANAVGDLDGLRSRLQALTGLLDHRREEHKAAREQARTLAHQAKERIAAEAERIAAEATPWKITRDRR